MKKRGLSAHRIAELLKEHGLNEIEEVNKLNPLKILFRQIKGNYILYLLTLAAVLSLFIGKDETGYTIFAVIFVLIIIGFTQEYRAEKAVSELKKMLMPTSIVIRDGSETSILSKYIVPGDLLVIRAGERIPADCSIIESNSLIVDESTLTGESKPVEKNKSGKKGEEDSLFMGTYVVNGKCVALVKKTGMSTRFGKIAELISKAEKEMPLQKKLNNISKYMAFSAIGFSLLTGLVIFLRAESLTSGFLAELFVLVIALSVSSFPESLPVVLITTLSYGARNMARKNAIVHRMSIIETLGETTVICSDKTGTITKGEMTVRRIYSNNNFFDVTGEGYNSKGKIIYGDKEVNLNQNNSLKKLLEASILCNDTKIERTGEDSSYKILGDPTEGALLILGTKKGLFLEDLKFEKIQEFPFDSERKMMSTLCRRGNEKIVFSKGALEILLKKCTHLQTEQGIFKLREKDKKRILNANSLMTCNSFRTIGLAYKNYNEKENIEENLVFLGITGLEDPPRHEVKEAIINCRTAGIVVKMITGDHRETALAIANQIGLKGDILDGFEIDELSDEGLRKAVTHVQIFARVRPEHKLRIVKALKENGEIVSMTGDGVNDAPALKESHIGIAMGNSGTDVTRSVADLTLKDDNFATIVSAIKEGRSLFNNIRKFVTYQLSCSSAELGVLFFGVLLTPFFGWPVPIFIALQILFMNLVTDDLPAITLGLNPSSGDIMNRAPRRNAQLIDKKFVFLLLASGFLMALFTLFSFYLASHVFNQSDESSRTIALITLIFFEIANAFNFRSFRKPVLGRSLLTNKYLFVASSIAILATLLIVYTPLNALFGTSPIGLIYWLPGILLSALLIIIFDLFKLYNEKKKVFNFDK